MQRRQHIFLLLVSISFLGCRSADESGVLDDPVAENASGEPKANQNEVAPGAVMAAQVQEVTCTIGEQTIFVKGVSLDGLDVATINQVGVVGMSDSIAATTSYQVLNTVPLTHSWDFQAQGMQMAVSSQDNIVGAGVAVVGTGGDTQRIELPCNFVAEDTPQPLEEEPPVEPGIDVGMPVQVAQPVLDLGVVKGISCKGPTSETVALSMVGEDILGDGNPYSHLKQSGVEILPDEFEVLTSTRQEESTPVQYVWTGAYRETFVEIYTSDLESGSGVLFAEAAGEIQRVDLTCTFTK